jgi:hypothetical protein
VEDVAALNRQDRGKGRVLIVLKAHGWILYEMVILATRLKKDPSTKGTGRRTVRQ